MSARLRTIAASSALGLAAGSAAILGAASPASAATVTFDCEVPILGPNSFPAEVNATGTTAVVGAKTGPGVTVDLTVPDSLADSLRFFLQAEKAEGTIASTNLFGETPGTSTLVIPSTDLPEDGDIVLNAAGKLAAVPGNAGDVVPVTVGDQDVAMVLTKTDGSTQNFDIPCTPAADQELTLGEVTLVKATSKSKTTAKYAKKTKKAKITTKVTTNGARATGKVKMVVKKGKKTVAKKAVAIKNSTAKLTLKLKKKGKYKVTTSYAGNKNVTGSKSKATVKVK